MKCNHSLTVRTARARLRAMTLVEVMVSVGVAMVVLLAVSLLSITGSRNFAAAVNYVAMDQANRSTLDQMTRDIRRATNVVSFATNMVVLTLPDGTNVTYRWD